MSVCLVSYDLRTPGRDYAPLHTHLKSYAAWAKPLESLWLIKSSLSATAVRDTVSGFIDSNDKLFVVNVSSCEAAWQNFSEEVAKWIQANL